MRFEVLSAEPLAESEPKFFVLHRAEGDAADRYEIQFLDIRGQAVAIAWVSGDGTVPESLPFRLPHAVVDAAIRLRAGQGDYVDSAGRSRLPF